MKLTQKDREFLETLKRLMESKDLSVELKPDRPSYMVLRGTYGERMHEAFGVTRQGVRWRFQRVLGDMYVSAFEAILTIERIFGAQLRDHAMRISKERHALRQEVARNGLQPAESLNARRQNESKPPGENDVEM